MAGPVPAIYVFEATRKAWMYGTAGKFACATTAGHDGIEKQQ
jgi:hypothetical protein